MKDPLDLKKKFCGCGYSESVIIAQQTGLISWEKKQSAAKILASLQLKYMKCPFASYFIQYEIRIFIQN